MVAGGHQVTVSRYVDMEQHLTAAIPGLNTTLTRQKLKGSMFALGMIPPKRQFYGAATN